MCLKQYPIQLRAPEPNDVDFLFQMENDHKLWHVTNTLVPFSRFELEQYVFSTDKSDPFSTKQVRFIIDLEQENQLIPIGTIDLFDIDPLHRRAGIGIMVMEEHRNKGFARTALSLCNTYAFNDLHLHQLYCNIEEDNTASLSLFKADGFEIVGLKKQWNLRNGKWVNEFFMQKINDPDLK